MPGTWSRQEEEILMGEAWLQVGEGVLHFKTDIGGRSLRAKKEHWQKLTNRLKQVALGHRLRQSASPESPNSETAKTEPNVSSPSGSSRGKKRAASTPSPSKRAGNKAKKIKVEDFDDDSEASEHEDNDRDKHPEAEYTP